MEYKVVIGLEIHCELKTNSKVFSTSTNTYNSNPNHNITYYDLAYPGVLPVLNKEAVRKAIEMAICLNCSLPEYMIFDRKNYYYPDLPKGYQITQNKYPVGIDGKLLIDVEDYEKDILIHDIHLEEDTASLDHFSDRSLIDYNRSGVPLLETVTEPCISSSKEAVAFLEQLRSVFKYCDVSEADSKKGQIRCDVNISLMKPDDKELGTKVEIKNINSFSKVASAIEYEIKRQSELLDAGKKEEIIQETRRYDDATSSTVRMREKVDSVDYKYFTEPNLPPFKITEELINNIKKDIPLLALDRKKKYINDYEISEIDARTLVKEKQISDYFAECINLGINPKIAANWITTQILGYINKYNLSINDLYFRPKHLKEIIDYMDKKIISIKEAKDIFVKVIEEKKDVKEFIDLNNTQINDKDKLVEIIDTILSNNESQINDYKNGKTNLFTYFVGCVMKETRGKANPELTTQILKDKLN